MALTTSDYPSHNTTTMFYCKPRTTLHPDRPIRILNSIWESTSLLSPDGNVLGIGPNDLNRPVEDGIRVSP